MLANIDLCSLMSFAISNNGCSNTVIIIITIIIMKISSSDNDKNTQNP